MKTKEELMADPSHQVLENAIKEFARAMHEMGGGYVGVAFLPRGLSEDGKAVNMELCQMVMIPANTHPSTALNVELGIYEAILAAQLHLRTGNIGAHIALAALVQGMKEGVGKVNLSEDSFDVSKEVGEQIGIGQNVDPLSKMQPTEDDAAIIKAILEVADDPELEA